MLAEFVKKIAELATASHTVAITEIPDDPRTIFVQHGETVERVTLPGLPRAESIASLGDFIDAATDPAIAPQPEIYYGPTGAKVILNRGDRRESIRFPIKYCDQWKKLVSLANGVGLTPDQAIKLLRFDLSDGGADEVIKSLRKVDFQRTGTGTRTTEHGRESLGNSVEQRVQQADSIPESFAVRCYPSLSTGLRQIQVTVVFGVVIDFAQQQIFIKPLADQLTKAVEAFTVTFGEVLRAGVAAKKIEIPTFYAASEI